jgi:hypothetical protein
MGSSQSRPNDSKRYSRPGDQLKSVFRRPDPSTNGDDEKPHSAGVAGQEVANGNHDDTSIPEAEQKRASTAVCVLLLLHVNCGCALNLLSATTTCLHASHCSLSSNTFISFDFHLSSSYQSTELGRLLEVARMPS